MVTWNYVCEPCKRGDHEGCIPGSGGTACDCARDSHGRPRHRPKHRHPKEKDK